MALCYVSVGKAIGFFFCFVFCFSFNSLYLIISLPSFHFEIYSRSIV